MSQTNTMLCMKTLRQHCRTCLVNLEIDTKSFSIIKYPELRHLLEVCLARNTAADNTLRHYAPYLCCSCFGKWLDFLKLYKKALKSDEQIRKALEKEFLKTESENDKDVEKIGVFRNLSEYFFDTENLADIQEIEKYETNSPFYANNFAKETGYSNDIQEKPTPGYDPTTLSKRTEELKTLEDYKDGDVDISSSSSGIIQDIYFVAPLTRKPQTSKKSGKLPSNIKTYKTRKSRFKRAGNQVSPKKADENTTEICIEAKKVRYQCELCRKYFWEKNKYDGHIKQVHEGIRRPFQCLECDKAYILYKTLLQHKRECHSEKPQQEFKCEECDKTFKTAVILKQHITNKHSEQKDEMRSICDQCGFIAAHQYSLSRHIINKHTEPIQIKCHHCPKVFKSQYSLKCHVIDNHNPTNIKPFKCPECQKSFTRKTLLNQHERTHLKYMERMKCDFEGCEVRFVKHRDKTHHMRLVHLKVKQHICDFCGEAFGAMQTLRHHRFIHTGEKPYKCNVCGQAFRQRTAMKTHRKTHFGKDTDKQGITNNLSKINLVKSSAV